MVLYSPKFFLVGFRHCFVTGFSVSYKNKRNNLAYPRTFSFFPQFESARGEVSARTRGQRASMSEKSEKRNGTSYYIFSFPSPDFLALI